MDFFLKWTGRRVVVLYCIIDIDSGFVSLAIDAKATASSQPNSFYTCLPPSPSPPFPSSSAPLNLLALVLFRNRTSSCANVLPFVSGNRHHDHPSPSTAVAAQKKPALAPHAHAVGFSILGVMMLVTMPDML